MKTSIINGSEVSRLSVAIHMEPGMTMSHVACLHGIQPSLLFKWKKQYQEGSLTAVAVGGDCN